MNGKWIWLSDKLVTENERGCFVTSFMVEETSKDWVLRITAVSRYALYLNGVLLGRGPIRSEKRTCYFDAYDLTSSLQMGENTLAVEVWNYGWSNYQCMGDTGGLLFEVTYGGETILCSDEKVRCCRNTGHLPYSPKRNVNLGFADYYDARRFTPDWKDNAAHTKMWSGAALCDTAGRTLKERPIRPFHVCEQYPQRILRVEDVTKNCQVITVNTRRAFYGERNDANETNFNGFLGCEICSEKEMQGRISFPNRTWNGILGTFRIGGQIYEITDQARDVCVTVPAGKSLFLMQIHGKFDDLYSHIEFRFDIPLQFVGMGSAKCFFAIGPTAELGCNWDGKHSIAKDIDFYTEKDRALFACTSLQALQATGAQLCWVQPQDVMEDAYLLSLNRLAQVQASYSVQPKHMGILWNNDACTVFDVPKCGDYRRILVDFGDEYVGNLEFCLKASAGTIVEFYGFENIYQGEIDFTIGMNNGARYICRDGWQQYTCMARMGMRYVMVSVRNSAEPVLFKTLKLQYSTYSTSNQGAFACSDDALNRIWEMCRHTHALCLEDCFVDCPAYEQTYWLGDAQTSGAANAFLFGDFSFLRHNLVLAQTAAQNSPLFNALTPTDWDQCIPLWTMHWLISVVQYVQASGDRSVVEVLAPSLHAVLHYYSELITPEGGFCVSAWNLVDWAPLDTPAGCVVTCYQGILAYCYQNIAALLGEIGQKENVAVYEETAQRLLRFLDTHLWNEKRQAYCDSWTREHGFGTTYSVQTHSLLSLYGVIRQQERQATVNEYLLKLPKDFVDVGSPFMLYYLYEAWAGIGKTQEIFEDVKQRWGEMLRFESTTCWEVFPGFYENSRTRSYCHSWSVTPAMLMQKYLLGIRRESDGFADVSLCFPNTPLRWCRGTVPTPHGAIYVDWNKDDKLFFLRIPEKIRLHGNAPEGFRMVIQRTTED